LKSETDVRYDLTVNGRIPASVLLLSHRIIKSWTRMLGSCPACSVSQVEDMLVPDPKFSKNSS
jgi:hypothetical protein